MATNRILTSHKQLKEPVKGSDFTASHLFTLANRILMLHKQLWSQERTSERE
jgi:hypothetical protein